MAYNFVDVTQINVANTVKLLWCSEFVADQLKDSLIVDVQAVVYEW